VEGKTMNEIFKCSRKGLLRWEYFEDRVSYLFIV